MEDQDINPGDFVDRIIMEQWLSPESGNMIQMEFPGEFNSGFLRMSFNVVCNETLEAQTALPIAEWKDAVSWVIYDVVA